MEPVKQCRHGSNCYRKNQEHLKEYAHKHLSEIRSKGLNVSNTYDVPAEHSFSQDIILEQLKIMDMLFPLVVSVVDVDKKHSFDHNVDNSRNVSSAKREKFDDIALTYGLEDSKVSFSNDKSSLTLNTFDQKKRKDVNEPVSQFEIEKSIQLAAEVSDPYSLQVNMNTRVKPSEVHDFPWLFCKDMELQAKYSVHPMGKWMMFFSKGLELDLKWYTACELYQQRKLTGICSLKVSTSFDNDRASNKSDGVIIFYCGPAGDQYEMIEHGTNLLNQIEYQPRYGGYMYYKSDEQTMAGTRATGQKNNSLYKIKVRK